MSFMHHPMDDHVHALWCIMHYMHGISQYGLHIYPSSIISLIYYTDDD